MMSTRLLYLYVTLRSALVSSLCNAFHSDTFTTVGTVSLQFGTCLPAVRRSTVFLVYSTVSRSSTLLRLQVESTSILLTA